MQKVVNALSVSVESLDAARRVGWAKAYAAEDREADACRDLNMARADLAIVVKLTAVMYGVITVVAQGCINELPGRDHIVSMLPEKQIRDGQRIGGNMRRRKHEQSSCSPKQHTKWKARVRQSDAIVEELQARCLDLESENAMLRALLADSSC